MDTNCPENFWTPLLYLDIWQTFTLFGCRCMISLLTLLSNMAVIFSIVRTNQTNNAFCRLMLFLSLSDCSGACATQMLHSVMIFKPGISCVLQITSQFLNAFFAYTSGYIIVATGFERMVNINNRQQSSQNSQIKRAYVIGIICILLAFVTDFVYTTFTAFGMFHLFEHVLQVLMLISLILLLISFMVIYRKVYYHVKDTVVLRITDNLERNTSAGRPIYLISTTKMMLRILAAFCIAYMPYVVLNLCLRYGLNAKSTKYASAISFGRSLPYIFIHFNTTANAVIFMTGNKKCKRFMKNMW